MLKCRAERVFILSIGMSKNPYVGQFVKYSRIKGGCFFEKN